MNPASAMKLLTTYAGLELLGPAHTWRTEALAENAFRPKWPDSMETSLSTRQRRPQARA
jgi:hypothetical protein